MAGRKNYTQMKIAGVLGVSQAAVSRKLRGEVPFEIEDLSVLAEEWGVPITELIPRQRDQANISWSLGDVLAAA
jgi:predicted transcriptional regulator